MNRNSIDLETPGQFLLSVIESCKMNEGIYEIIKNKVSGSIGITAKILELMLMYVSHNHSCTYRHR